MTSLLNRARIVQNAYVVNDIEEACRRLHEIYGIGPFLGGPKTALAGVVHRGEKAPDIEISAVFVQSGDMNVELIQQHSDGPSAFRDLFPKGKQGFHHVAVFCDDYEAERDAFVGAGYPVASEFDSRVGCKICYVDTTATLGHMIELYPENETIRDMYAQTRAAAENWSVDKNGGALIRPFG